MDSMTMAMSPYAARYARVAPGGMRRSNINPAQAPSFAGGPVPASPALSPVAPPPGSMSMAGNSAVPLATAPSAPMAPAAPGTIAPGPYNPNSLDSNVQKFQDYAKQGVEGYADMAGQDFRKQVGGVLGDLNSIGGLRSGATVTSMNDLTTNYARQIGDYSKMAASGATAQGQEEFDAATERQYRADAEKRARKHSLISGIGTVLGGVGGFFAGGPAGAVAGATAGSKL